MSRIPLLSTLSRPRFLYPVLLFVALISLFLVIEHRTESNVLELQETFNNKASQFAFRLEEAVQDFQAVAESFQPAAAMPEQLEGLRGKFQNLRQRAEELEKYFSETSDTALLYNDDFEFLRLLPGLLGRVENLLRGSPSLQDEAFDDLKQQTAQLSHRASHFYNAVQAAHQASGKNLFASIARARTEREILFVLIFLGSLFFIGLLYGNVRHQQRTLQHVRSVEHHSALYASVLQSAREGIMVINMHAPGQPVVFTNKTFVRLTGYDQVLMNNKQVDVLFGPDSEPATIASFQNAIRHRESSAFDLLIYRRNGSSFWSEWHISPVEDRDGALTHYVFVFKDISDLRQTREALSLAEKQTERTSVIKSNFLAAMSREIRAPLDEILESLRSLRQSSYNWEHGKLLDAALNTGASLHEVIHDILDYAKIEARKINVVAEPFSLRELLKNIVEMTRPLAASKNLDIRLEIPDDLPDRLTSDEARLRQIILNLLTNAIKFTDWGYIKIRVQHLLTKTDNEQPVALLRFEVIDTGIGIGAGDQEHLFEEFVRIEHSSTHRFHGTGLGLAISRCLVNLLNGEIGVESKPGTGSKFWFMLPLRIDSSPEPSASLPLPSPRLFHRPGSQPACLLLVEDGEMSRLVASRYLGKAGYKHDIAVTGAEALSLIKARTYDLILLDISMSDMNGLDMAREIRARGGWAAAVPIIALTVHTMADDCDRFRKAGMNDYLCKPLDYETLARMIESWLGTSSQNSAPKASVNIPVVSSSEMDMSIIQRMVSNIGVHAMMRMTQVFLDDFAKHMEDLRACCERQATENIERSAQALKSSSANCGLMGFAELMADFEMAAEQDDMERIQTLLQQLAPAYAAARQALIKERDRYQTI